MACSPVQLAKRALATLLLTLARQYAMPAEEEGQGKKEGAEGGITDTRLWWSRLRDRARAPVQGEVTSVGTQGSLVHVRNKCCASWGGHPAT